MKLQKQLISQIKNIVSNAQQRAVRSVNTERVAMYWQIGKVIFEEEQQGKDRAEYSKFLIKNISEELQPLFGTGFTVRQLEMNRQFYRTFPNTNALRSQFSWTHYRTLIRIDNQDKRTFYIAEAEKNNWSTRQLERQVNSQLFERLLRYGTNLSTLSREIKQSINTILMPKLSELGFLGLRDNWI